MIGFKSLAISLFTFASIVSATFEPLTASESANELRAYSVSDIYRRNQFSSNRHFLRSTPNLAPQVSGYLSELQGDVSDFKTSVSNACKGGFKGKSTTKVSQTVQPLLNGCKKKVHDCGQKIKGCGGGGPKPSGTPSKPPPNNGGGAGGCSGQLADVIAEIIATIALLEAEIKSVPILKSLLEGFLEELNEELTVLVAEANKAVPGVQSKTSTFLSSFEKQMKVYGISI